MRILSLCTSAGLWDRAFLEAGHDVVPGCEIAAHKRAMYREWCGGTHLAHDIAFLADGIRGQEFDGIIGGIPCQSRSRTKAMRTPKFGDLLPFVLEILEACRWEWAIFENVTPLEIPGFQKVRLDAMHFGRPHQSRPRWFTFKGVGAPGIEYPGTVDSLMAFPVVAAKIYGPTRGAILQGWPEFSSLRFPCPHIQEALADGVPRCLADAWLRSLAERNRS